MRRPAWLPLLLIALALLAGCSDEYDAERRAGVANATLYVASAVTGDVRYGGAPADADGQALLSRLRDANASLLEPLAAYAVKARRQGLEVAILVCEADGGRALVEDAGCTQTPDAQYWEDDVPCAFQIDLATVCAR